MSELPPANTILRETGLIIDQDDEFFYVQTKRTTGCSGCSSESGCGTSALAKLFVRNKPTPLKVRKTQDCQLGDEVELLLDESRLLKHSFMAYGLPLIGLFIGAILLEKIALISGFQTNDSTEIFAILGALLGMFLGWRFTQKYYDPVLPELGQVLKKKPQQPIKEL